MLTAVAPSRTAEVLATETLENLVVENAQVALKSRLFHQSQHITCEFREGLLLLHGRVSSYYQKQLAQEAVRRLDAVDQILNHIEVQSV